MDTYNIMIIGESYMDRINTIYQDLTKINNQVPLRIFHQTSDDYLRTNIRELTEANAVYVCRKSEYNTNSRTLLELARVLRLKIYWELAE